MTIQSNDTPPRNNAVKVIIARVNGERALFHPNTPRNYPNIALWMPECLFAYAEYHSWLI